VRGAPLPRELPQADFDIVGPAEGPPGSFREEGAAAADAEVLKVGLEVAEAAGISGATMALSHRELLSAAWRAAGVPAGLRADAASLLRTLPASMPLGDARDALWRTLRRQLSDGLGISSLAVDRLEAIHRVGGAPGAALPRLRGVLRASAGSRAAAALEGIGAAVSMAEILGVPDSAICVAPLLAPVEAYFSGLFFQVYATPRGSDRGVVLAAGGRYDALIATSWPGGADTNAPGGVCVSFITSRLVSLASTTVHAIDALVAARGRGGSLPKRLALTAALWAAGIRAETLYSSAPSLTDFYAHAARRGARWLLIISDAGAIRVKHLDRRTVGREEDCSDTDECVRHLAALVGGMERGPSEVEPPDAREPEPEPALSRGGRRRKHAPNSERRE